MNLPEFSVKRKVTTIMITGILIVLGFIAFSRLGLDFFPDIDYPTVSIVTIYSGVSSEEIENTITKPIEQIVSSVNRVKKVSSISQEGVSVVMVEFEWGTNLDFAAQDIRDRIGLYRNYLPEDATDPLVVKFSFTQFPIIFYGVTSNKRDLRELKRIMEDSVAGRLERLDGVASAQVFSPEEREILINIDRSSLESRNLTLEQVVKAIKFENLNLPAGYIEEAHSEYLVRTVGEFKNLEEIKNIVVGATQDGKPIYLKEIAKVEDTIKETRYVSRIQRKKGVFIMINKRSDANTVKTVNEVKKEIEKIKETLPSDIKFHEIMDQSDMIKRVTNRTANNALIGGILAIFFIFLFLRNWRPTITIAFAIPLSIITTFIAFYVAGYTLNLMTLGGLALGIGMLVDNAIVVIENIFRYLEEGKDSESAAKIGASEVGMAITAATLTTIAVFFPMLFASGITGQLVRGLALSVSFALISSLFVALTIVPLFASLLFKIRRTKEEYEKSFGERQFLKVKNLYKNILFKALKHRGKVLLIAFGIFIISLLLIPFIGTEFMPAIDRSMIILDLKLPVGTSLSETTRVVNLVEEVFLKEKDVEIISSTIGTPAEEDPMDVAMGFSAAGPHESFIWVGLKSKPERKIPSSEILERIRHKLPRIKNAKFEAIDMSQMFFGGSRTPIDIKIYGKDLELMKRIADNIIERIKNVEGIRDLTHSLMEGKPEYQIEINREYASRSGLTVGQIASVVQTATLGKIATRYRVGGEEIDIRVRLQEKDRDSIEDLKKIKILSPFGKSLYLAQVADFKRGIGPIQINRENQMRKISVTANIAGRDLGSIVRDIRKRLSGIEKYIPSGYFVEIGGQYKEMQNAFVVMAQAFALAVLLVYMVMASQFESFSHPFVIMFTIPLSFIGVILALLITGKTVNLPVLIGFVILAGIAVNNGIVMIDYINQLRRKGIDAREAIITGASVRLRPILITAFTTMLGMLPMALSTSEGAEFRSPMAIAVIGGLFATTFLTLFIIPIIYSLINRISFKEKK
ncbi:efflux RND transporter permease subunit [Candidatus Aminicenantes bacterium AC-335-K20]|jgi:HAE1 family hydrophobic/amphiphilic exporter-1|nr:efflux RND transporter permease subunit [SCandidatus Aminicenantes bacterium Aminicenantia_JdfR_composite]MCP2619163.1 efflux RND transporter permease subunit [Candidatus Aminicenantes bacterium AC-335-K20]MCP2620656.1 efflux RND transporter permease subunit [Candidatus Aminicenantes bacterium AC-334-E05]